MSNSQHASVTELITQRKQMGISDVPIFAQALQVKLNKKDIVLPETKITGVSGDPRSGQTLGFPLTPVGPSRIIFQSHDSRLSVARASSAQQSLISAPSLSPQPEQVEVLRAKVFSFLREDPSLIRNDINSDALREHLGSLSAPTSVIAPVVLTAPEPVVAPAFELPSQLPLLAASHDEGLLDVAVVPEVEMPAWVQVEPTVYALKRGVTTIPVSMGKHALKQAVVQCLRRTFGLASFVTAEVVDLAGSLKIVVYVAKLTGKGVVTITRSLIGLPITAIKELCKAVGNGVLWGVECVTVGTRALVRWVKRTVSLPSITLPSVTLPSLTLPQIRVVPVTLNLPKKQQLYWSLGQTMIVGSVVMLLFFVGPIIRLQAEGWFQKSRIAMTGQVPEPEVRENLIDVMREPEETPPEEKQFQLLIPKINVNSKVIANVDASSEKEYNEALKKGVAHAAGSNLPGEEDTHNRTVYIFGHSTNGTWNISRYNALFYNLKDLVVGDDIIMWFWGKEYHYTVTQTSKVDPNDVSYLQPQTDKDQLILQTCWPPGTTLKRLLVVAEPKAR